MPRISKLSTYARQYLFNLLEFLNPTLLNHLERPFNYLSGINKRPWDFPQIQLLESLYSTSSTYSIFIVGASNCDELMSLRHTSSIGSVVVFEPVIPTPPRLLQNISRYFPNAHLIPSAAGSFEGTVEFWSTTIQGTSSTLKPSRLTSYHGVEIASNYPVHQTTVDKVSSNLAISPDILWIDVQGAETSVLQGSSSVLKSVTYVLIEVSLSEPTYVDGSLFDDIFPILTSAGLTLVGLNVDARDLTGNALFYRVP